MPGFLTLPGGWEWLIILGVILLIFAPREGSKIIRTIGRGIRELTDFKRDVKKDFNEEVSDVFNDAVKPENPKRQKRSRRNS